MSAPAGSTTRRVAVVGGGIAGLAAAHSLAVEHGCAVELFEADGVVGGKMRTTPFAGLAGVDEGPDAFLARVPGATSLARTVGLGGSLVSPRSGSAAVWWDRLHPIPSGLLLGMPTGIGALARTRLLTWRGKARAALEPVLPATPTDRDSLGGYVRARFGDEVHERLVDPLVGSIYAADTDRFSLAAVPQIAALAESARSVLLEGRRRAAAPPDSSPVFYAPEGGLAAFAAAVAGAAEAAGAVVHLKSPVDSITPCADGWLLDSTEADPFDAVVIAVPASNAVHLLRAGGADASAAAVGAIDAADVAIVSVAVDRASWPQRLVGMSGYLVPKPVQRLVTAVSFGSQKWAHWDGGDSVVLRISLGRDGLPVLHLDDRQLVDAALAEAGDHLGVDLRPSAVRVSRWPEAFPQYRPHHAALVAEARRHLPRGLALTGAAFDGIGIPACVRSGQAAADSVATPQTAHGRIDDDDRSPSTPPPSP